MFLEFYNFSNFFPIVQTDLIYMVFIVLLVMFILMINSFYTIHKVCPNEIDIGSIKTESCNITDAYKELKEGKTQVL